MEENAVTVIIPNISGGEILKRRISFWSRIRFLERLTYVGSEQIEAARFRGDIYLKAGGHDDDMVAYEEHDVHNKISKYGRIVRVRGAYEWHVGEPSRLSDIVIKHWYYGTSVRR